MKQYLNKYLNENSIRLGVAFIVAICFSLFQLYTSLFGIYQTGVIHRAVHLCFVTVLFFLIIKPINSNRFWIKLLDWSFVVLGVFAIGYFILFYEHILNIIGTRAMTPQDLVSSATIFLLIILEAWKSNKAFFGLTIIFIVYALFGSELPGIFNHPGLSIKRLLYLIVFTSEGIFGMALDVSATYLFLFMFFGVVLEKTGTGSMFIDSAMALVGRYRGGPAKTAVIASAGLGSIVGSSIGNVVTSGTFTIPLMQRMGFKRHVAASVETVASEGGQLLPPVMGAGAFIMAAITGIAYNQIAFAALVPAILYFISVWFVIDFEARNNGLMGVPENELPRFMSVMKSKWHLMISLLVLIYCLLIVGMTPTKAGVMSIFAALFLAMLRKNTRLKGMDFILLLKEGAEKAVEIAMLCASIGIIVGVITSTGLALRFSQMILSITNGHMFLTLLLTMLATVIIGMGLPTPIAYLLMALFASGALIEAGVPTLAAHLFLFYFAVKSGSTPPIAIVATVAAGIANANWFKTAMTAFRFSLPSFIIAYMFVYYPGLLMNGKWYEIIISFVIAVIGVISISGAMQKWWFNHLNIFETCLLALGSILLVIQGLYNSILGILIIASLGFYKGFFIKLVRKNLDV